MSQTLRWGIMGTGNIAAQFSTGVNASRRGRLQAVGSRREETARAFADRFQIPTIHNSYDALLRDPLVDVIYISLPNSMHREWTIKALNAGKHVLCEKPFAANASEAQEMFDAAARNGKALMEAFMYRCHPQTLAIIDAVKKGAIGELRLIRTNFCFKVGKVAGNIRFDPGMAGGSLMDVGTYCINFSRLFAGQEPSAISVCARKHESGVDEVASGMMQFPNGVLATFSCGMSVHADNTAYLCGSDGYIEIPIPWKPPVRGAVYSIAHSIPPRMDLAGATAPPPRKPREQFTIDAGMELYAIEADDFATTILDGAPVRVSRDDTMGNMRVLDEMRRQLGILV